MKQWDKRMDGTSPSFQLTKEADPIWYATVSMFDGRWIFAIGKRIKDGDINRQRYVWMRKGWRSSATAKQKALYWIRQKR